MDKASITLKIELALDADKSEAVKAISAIRAFFGDEIQPKDAVTINREIAAFPATVTGATDTSMSEGRPSVEAMATSAPDDATRDKNGLPWDERIHSSSKAFNQDGTWRYKKGCPADLKSRVEAELRAAVAGNAAPAPAAAAPAPLPPPPVAAPAPLPPPPAAPAPATNPEYAALLDTITANMAPLGRIPNNDWVTATLTAYGVPEGSLQNLAHMPDKIGTIHAAIKQALGIQ